MTWKRKFLFRSKPDFMTGKPIFGLVMHRKIKDSDQYRAMNGSEELEYLEESAW